jgi:hypothetical protein
MQHCRDHCSVWILDKNIANSVSVYVSVSVCLVYSQGSYEVAWKHKGPLTSEGMGKITGKSRRFFLLRETYRLSLFSAKFISSDSPLARACHVGFKQKTIFRSGLKVRTR